ncbi:MAG: rnhC [Anaerosporomusa subterranea]|jgi:ribonuclease HIII|nr:rnhC [Anaerosporomusa subterranea]
MAALEETVASITKNVTENDLVIASSRSIAYGVQLTITDAKESITLNIYSGKKGISLTLGGSAASQLRQKVESLLAVPPRQSAQPTKPQGADLGFANVEGFDGRWIGTDESGKGDFFGPLVVGAVLVDDETEAQLVAKGIKDCKVLSDAKVRALAVSIREICHGRYVELELLPSRYNALYQQLRTEGKNLNQLLAWAHARAIEDLLQKEPCRFAIVDQFADERQILSRLMAKGKALTLIQSHRAERNIAVAAASVLARDRFLARLDSFRAQYGMEFPKGASAAVIAAGRRFAAERGREALIEVAKVHFKTMEEI